MQRVVVENPCGECDARHPSLPAPLLPLLLHLQWKKLSVLLGPVVGAAVAVDAAEAWEWAWG